MATIYLQLNDGTVQLITVTAGSAPNKVMLSGAPRIPLAVEEDQSVKTVYELITNTDTRIRAFIAAEKEPKDTSFTSTVKAVNYDDRYYTNDLDSPLEDQWTPMTPPSSNDYMWTHVGDVEGNNSECNVLWTGTAWLTASFSKIQRSTDGGATWNTVYTQGSGSSVEQFVMTGSTILAVAGGSCARSTDGGATWNTSNVGWSGFRYGLVSSGGGHWLCWGNGDGGLGGGYYSSDDDGLTWTQHASQAPYTEVWRFRRIIWDGAKYVGIGRVTRGATTTVEVVTSTTGLPGTWTTRWTTPDINGDWPHLTDIATDGAGHLVVVGLAYWPWSGIGQSFVVVSSDGAVTWTRITSFPPGDPGLSTGGPMGVAFGQGVFLICDAMGYVMMSEDFGATWTKAWLVSVDWSLFSIAFNGSYWISTTYDTTPSSTVPVYKGVHT